MIRWTALLAPSICSAGLLVSQAVGAQTAGPETAAPPPVADTQAANSPASGSASGQAEPGVPLAEAATATPVASDPPPPVEGPAAAPAGGAAGVAAPATTGAPAQDPYAATPSEATLVEDRNEQPPLLLGVMWDVSLPLGATADFAGPISGRGFALDLRYWGFGKFGIGGSFVWDTMSHKGMNERTIGNSTISGVAVKELDSNVFVGKIFASPFDWNATRREGRTSNAPSRLLPYAAFGFGGDRIVRRVDVGANRYVDESWHWVFAPEIGVEAPTHWGTWMLALRFNYVAGSSDGPEQMFMNFGLGAGF